MIYIKNLLYLILFQLSIIVASAQQVVLKMQKERGVYMIPCKVNGKPLKFIFDTGAGDVSISLEEAADMLSKGLINKDDFFGIEYYQDATGKITEGFKLNIKELQIDKIILRNVQASVLKTLNAPLLLGQTALSKLGKIEFDPVNSTLTILNKKLINESFVYESFKELLNNNSGYVDNFCGFKLLQYEDCILKSLGEADQMKKEGSNSKILTYNLIQENSTKNIANLNFYLKSYPSSPSVKQIEAILLHGVLSEYSIRGITLGSSMALVEEVFGDNYEVSDKTTEFGNGKYVEYKDCNISFEFNNGLVTTVLVGYREDNIDEDLINSQATDFKLLKDALLYLDSTSLVNLFAADFEIIPKNKKNIHFSTAFSSEIKSNKELLKFINDKNYGLKSLFNPNVKVEYKFRVSTSAGFLIVLSIKNSTSFSEITFRPYMDKYLIWDIR